MSTLVTTTTCDDEGTWLVTLHGDHDFDTWPELTRETSPMWALCNAAVIDLSDAAFIDSGVVRWLIDVERQLDEAGGATLSIVEGPPASAASRLLQLLRVDHVLACYQTLEEALTQASGAHPRSAWAGLAEARKVA